MQSRLNHLRELLQTVDIDSILVSSPSSIAYLTGYLGFSEVEREAFLLITNDSVFLLTDARYTTAFKKHQDMTVLTRSRENPVYKLLQSVIAKKDLKKMGFEPDDLTVSEYQDFQKVPIQFVPISLRELRILKNTDEIRLLQIACGIALKAFQKTKRMITPGITELEVVHRLELEMKKLSVNPSFPTIVAFGENAAIPHHLPGETKLKKNDIILMDFGAEYNGYCSDITRTFFIGSVPKTWQKTVAIVKESQQAAIDFIQKSLQEGKVVKAAEVDAVSRQYLIDKGYPSIPHALGHGVGLQVHEAPTLSPTSSDILSEGMVFSLEPGIYLPGEMGVRVEDITTIWNNELVLLS